MCKGGATKKVKVYFGGTAIFDSGDMTSVTLYDLDLNVSIIRDGSTSVRCVVSCTPLANTYTTITKVTGLTLSSTNILKVTTTIL